jgi:putative DNA methylase
MTDDSKQLWYKPKLIEVGLPLDDINRESTREKSIRHGHPSTLHLWWSRKPLATARAVLFAQLVDDPSAHPDKFPTEEDQAVERKRLHDIISRLVVWENIHDEALLKEAHDEILKSTGGNPPPILDPFAGGGSIPLEAQRLGLEAHASDLNPVAVLINKALIEIPPKFADQPPVFPGAAAERLSWPGATGLAEDVRRYGKWMRDEAERRIGHLYPKVKLPSAVTGQPGTVEATVIAWIWARTVSCPNPACGGAMPLVNKFWLGKKKGKERYVVPVPDGKMVHFEIGGPGGFPPDGTVTRTGAECLLCSTPVPLQYIREEAKAGRMNAQLMAIAAEGKRQRYYVAPDEYHEKAANVPRPADVPEAELPERALSFRVQGYGMLHWADLFTDRQLASFMALSSLVQETREQIITDGAMPPCADAIATYLGLALSRVTERNSALCSWDAHPSKEQVRGVFARQALAMNWDFAESNIFADSSGSLGESVGWVASAIDGLPAKPPGSATQASATHITESSIISTDPPYYDNIGYADLSDYFYVWLRQSIGPVYPELLGTLLTPKSDELIASPFRHKDADKFFEDGFNRVFARICGITPAGYPITVFYAFKQAESDSDGGSASTGWETLLEGMLSSGWAVSGTWPIRTELMNKLNSIGTNSLASSIVLACRPRPADVDATDRRGLIAALRTEFPKALKKLEQGKVAPVDLRQAAIGPGMAIFSRYRQVNEPDGSRMRVRSALSLINQVLDENLKRLDGSVSPDTRWAVEWFELHGFDQGPFGTADVLARGTDTDMERLRRAGVVKSAGGKVSLVHPHDLPDSYDPAKDDRPSEWKICLQIAKLLQTSSPEDAARLMAESRDIVDLDNVKDLAYLLYSIAEKKAWPETALLFNALGTSWTDVEDSSRKVTGPRMTQGELEFGDEDEE